ncbi:alpha/beta-hydrolase [Lentinula edodes]|uniref:Alpha/beta-hydrolase n=1 Tax=Lentinula lateritia TaxID=40482 RepID=A0A9W8ZSU8_9AGAR|nr:alpha/beta-hydrolase [Lentinula edodes]
MPFIKVSTSTGNTRFHYTISTPACADAEAINPGLPVILFFHAFAFHTIFHSQFSDPILRKFNLVTFDMRWHGYTESDTIPERYGQAEAAEDIIAFTTALQLPPCHFVALDMGSTIALQIAVMLPEQVLSLFIMSHICLEEIPEVQEGRTELYDLYITGAYLDVALGYSQYTFSNKTSNIVQALWDLSFPINVKNWSPEHLREYRLISYDFFCTRKPQPREALSRITCPVKLVHGGNSVVYDQSYTERFMKSLQDEGVNVSMEIIPNAPHYLCFDHGNVVNPMIHDFVVEHHLKKENTAPIASLPVDVVVSPWDKILREHGWVPERKNELDDEDLFISYPTK